MSAPVTGGCLCGAVRFEAELENRELGVCFCTQCLRQNSGPLVCAAGPALRVAWTKGNPSVWRSSDTATRGFCRDCGSTLYWQRDGKAPELSHGSFDERGGFTVTRIVHENTRPDAYRLVSATNEAPND
ncbi:MAG: GFA family protein [Paracoccus sp. (in: a-proteobacteria)]|nr:GFA family protein [Paracoccus sp. (in: a-proteobacteria)]